jgi:hypothetical protein
MPTRRGLPTVGRRAGIRAGQVQSTKYEVENRRKYETRDTKQMSLVSCLPVGRQVSRLLLLRDLGTLPACCRQVLGTLFLFPVYFNRISLSTFFPLLLRHELLIR